MLCCDFAISSDDATFGEPEVKSAEPTNFPILPWVIGMRAAKKLAFLGDTLSAKEALELGILNEVVPKSELDKVCMNLANKLARIPANTLKVLKLGLNRGYELRGFKNMIDYSIELAIEHHFSRAEEEIEFGKMVRERGLKEALIWREKQFKLGESGKG
jgi:enoyl-CoA hydratase